MRAQRTDSNESVGAAIYPTDTQRVLKLTLPAGNYRLSSKVLIGPSPTAEDLQIEMYCRLEGPNSIVDRAEVRLTSPRPVMTIPLEGVIQLDNQGTVELDCTNYTGSNNLPALVVFAQNAVLTALVVGNVNVQQSP